MFVDKNRKVDGEEERKKNHKSGKKMGWKKNEKLFLFWSSGEATPDPNQEGSDDFLRANSTSGKALDDTALNTYALI